MSSEGSGTRVSGDGASQGSTGTAGAGPGTSGSQRRWMFFHELKKQKHGLSSMALLAACCVLSLRMLDQKRELDRLKNERESAEKLRYTDDRWVRRRMDGLRTAVLDEIRGANGNGSQSLERRVQELFSVENQKLAAAEIPTAGASSISNNEGLDVRGRGEAKGKFMV